ncbi:2-nitropropane dioxygenase [Melanogaster broomeanus]|nr:2-nitropropane dioxygenase [Melanogaster broomeanus]
MPIDTPITRLLGLKTPVVAAPMAGASGGALAAQVTAGGAFGFLAAGYQRVEGLMDELSLARGILQLAASEPLPIGVGYLGWQLEKSTAKAEVMLSAALDNHVQAIWLAFGNNLGQWIKYIRDYDAEHKRSRATIVFLQVSSVEEALVAIHDWRVDVLVAQGNESGGHGHGSAPPLLTLVPSILAVVPKGGPPLLAAGGLVTGSQVASLLVLGAAGAVLGTRFLMTPESQYTNAQKQALVAAKSDATVRTIAFDRARGTLDWPTGVDGRGLYNSTVKDLERGVDIETVKAKFNEGVRNGDPDRMLVWSGTGVGLVSDIKSAKDIVRELHEDIMERLKLASELCNDK